VHRVTQKHLLAPSLPALPSTMADEEVKLRGGDDAMCEVEKDVVECVPPRRLKRPVDGGQRVLRVSVSLSTISNTRHGHSTRPFANPRRQASSNRNWWVSLSLCLTPRWCRGRARNPHDRDEHPTPLAALTPRSSWGFAWLQHRWERRHLTSTHGRWH
jgi:hypothetical protein